jgi:hypothetical protein
MKNLNYNNSKLKNIKKITFTDKQTVNKKGVIGFIQISNALYFFSLIPLLSFPLSGVWRRRTCR